MYEIWTVARHNIRKTLQNRVIYFMPIIMLASSIAYITSYNNIIGARIGEGASSQAIYEASRAWVNGWLFLWPLAYILMANYIGTAMLVLEKTGRIFEPLMVTPVSIRQIWIGKSLGMTIVSLILGLSVSLLVFLGLSFGLVIPQTGIFVVPGVLSIVIAVTVVPLLALGVTLLTTRVQLTIANPRTASVVYGLILIGIVLGMVIPALELTNVKYDLFIYLGLIGVAGLLVHFVSRSLTSEKVVLSSKG